MSDETLIYTGPNVFPLALERFAVFRGGLPAYVKRAIAKLPEIESLIVPVSELEAMTRKIEKAGSNESRLYSVVYEASRKVR